MIIGLAAGATPPRALAIRAMTVVIVEAVILLLLIVGIAVVAIGLAIRAMSGS